MIKSAMNPEVDVYLSKTKKWQEEMEKLRMIIPALKVAFESLTQGRQRAYNFYFSEPKQSKTSESRVEKCIQQILNRIGVK
jgi:uncharacterized protein YdeI (YjbR/CyaY-like superfamily)